MSIKSSNGTNTPLEFDEYSEDIMEPLSLEMAGLAKDNFPEQLLIGLSSFNRHISVDPDEELEDFADLIDQGMGDLYKSHRGPNWKEDKVDELSEIGLVFIWYTKEGSSDVDALIAFKMTQPSYGKTLYLYEIQVKPENQGMKIGSLLISHFHQYASQLRQKASQKIVNLFLPGFLSTEYTGLTVFSDNEKALRWYKRLGYDLSEESPQDRHTRTRCIKPDYYELCRRVH